MSLALRPSLALLPALAHCAVCEAQPGSFREFPIPTPFSRPGEMVIGPDGALWFTEIHGNKIGRFEFPILSETRILEIPALSIRAAVLFALAAAAIVLYVLRT